jgi:hypothetical protein
MSAPHIQKSGSSLASVIGSDADDLADWILNEVPKNRPVALFYAKFWGRSMKEEEEKWRRVQPLPPTIGGEPGDEDQNGDERMDKGIAEDPEEDDGMDEDQGERTDLEDDILPGCYVLDIGIDGIAYSSIWVRAEYKRIYDTLEKFYDVVSRQPGQAPGAVLTGQPGIGEFLYCIT